MALGIGLLIGAERERRKGDGPTRAAAGIRTFTITSLLGAVSIAAGGTAMLAVAAAGVIVLAALAYWRSDEDDPGLTTEVALIVTLMLGGLAMQKPALAGGIAVVVAILLAARSQLHRFVRSAMTERELQDALIFAGAALVVLPLVPDRTIDPYGVLNPHAIWVLVILIMAISAAGYLAVRVLGARFGLPIAGLASGFISSTATIGAMGARAVKAPTVLPAAVAGAVLSTVATIVQMALVLGAASFATLQAMAVPLACAGATAAGYGAYFTLRALRAHADGDAQTGRAFSLSTALIFAATLSAIMLASAVLKDWLGTAGIILAAAVAGLVDTHSAAIAVAALVASGTMSAGDAVLPILAALSTNTMSKVIFAATIGGRAFALRVIPGLLLVAAAAWAGFVVAGVC